MGGLRLFFALVVAVGHYKFYHPSEPVNFPAIMTLGMNGGTAVMFFFIISGFLISFVLDKKYADTVHGAYNFYKSRFIRIYSLYWPLYFIAALMIVGVGAWIHRPIIDNVLTFILFGSDWRLGFAAYPEKWGYTTLFMAGTQLAWTLATEVTFYLIAPFVLRSMRAVICLFVMSLAIRFPLVYAFGFYEVWVYYFFPTVLFFFLLGHISRRIYDRFPIDPRLGMLFLIPAFIFSMMGVGKPFDSVYLYLSATCFAASLPFVFELTKDNRFLNALGNLSYPVYLSHAMLLMFYGSVPALAWMAPHRLYPAVGQYIGHPKILNVAVGVIVSIVVIVIATLVHFALEKPMSWLLRWAISSIERLMGRILKRVRWPLYLKRLQATS